MALLAQTRFDELARYWPILLPTALGMVGLYLLLPRARPYPRAAGIGIGLAALVLAGLFWFHGDMVVPERVLFYAFSGLALVGAGLMLTQTNPVHAALSFALVILSTCGLFLLQAAPFLMAATIIIYAGAIIVTFLFVIMLAQQEGHSNADMRSREPFLATVAGFVLLCAILCVLQRTYDTTTLDAYLKQAEAGARADGVDDLVKALGGDPDRYFKGFRKYLQGPDAPNRPERATVRDLLEELEVDAARSTIELQAMKQGLQVLHEHGVKLRDQQGSLQPASNLPLSSFSGTPPNAREPAKGLPAENVAALGRSLFGDYLLAVELAGMLLTVATIGAIVIAGRRTEGLR